MRNDVLWRKIARIIMLIAKEQNIDAEKALDLFYKSRVYTMLVDPRYGLQTMSDVYIYDEFMMELRGE